MNKLTYSDLIIEVQQLTADIDKHGYLLMFLSLLAIVIIILCVGILLRQNTLLSKTKDSFGSLRGKIDLQNQVMQQDAKVIGEIKGIIERNTEAINKLLGYLERSK